MASRREQKERLREERERREAAAGDSQRRRRLVGYGVGGGAVLVVAVVAVVLLAGGGGGDGSASADVLPDGGSFPEPREDVELAAAAAAAGCELESFRAQSRRHVEDPDEPIDYASKPPTSGPHHPPPAADDAAYEESPDVRQLVHTMEHGRVIVWFEKGLPAEQRAALKAYYDADPYQLALVPDTTGMTYEVAATAWNRDPRPNGTGRLLGCPRFNDDVFTAIEAFKDEHRGRGPEPVP